MAVRTDNQMNAETAVTDISAVKVIGTCDFSLGIAVNEDKICIQRELERDHFRKPSLKLNLYF